MTDLGLQKMLAVLALAASPPPEPLARAIELLPDADPFMWSDLVPNPQLGDRGGSGKDRSKAKAARKARRINRRRK